MAWKKNNNNYGRFELRSGDKREQGKNTKNKKLKPNEKKQKINKNDQTNIN